MYIPNINTMKDKTKIVDFMKRFSFATLITAEDNFPVATHLPFVIEEDKERLYLVSHFARANEQWKQIEKQTVMVIFSEPHAYISPTHYEKEQNVPTWNYISVHTYGKGHIIRQEEEVINILESTVQKYEVSYRAQWDDLSVKYKAGMIQGIVAFKIEVTEIQAKEKLSQNKTLNEQQKIIDTLSRSQDSNQQMIAEFMKKNLP